MTPENLFQLSLFVFAAVELWLTLRDSWRKITSVTKLGQGQLRLLLAVAFILAGLTRSLTLMPLTSQTSTPLLIGAVLIWCGMALRLWAVFTLGKFFRVTLTIQASHHVVTNGPYKYVRHPSYTGLLLVLIGLGVGLNDWLSLASIVILCGWALHQRIVVEERLLTSTLGSEYQEYTSHTKRLIPFIY